MKNVIKREQSKLACGLPSVNILSKVSKIQGVALPQKEQFRQAGKSTYYGAHYPQSLEKAPLRHQTAPSNSLSTRTSA